MGMYPRTGGLSSRYSSCLIVDCIVVLNRVPRREGGADAPMYELRCFRVVSQFNLLAGKRVIKSSRVAKNTSPRFGFEFQFNV